MGLLLGKALTAMVGRLETAMDICCNSHQDKMPPGADAPTGALSPDKAGLVQKAVVAVPEIQVELITAGRPDQSKSQDAYAMLLNGDNAILDQTPALLPDVAMDHSVDSNNGPVELPERFRLLFSAKDTKQKGTGQEETSNCVFKQSGCCLSKLKDMSQAVAWIHQELVSMRILEVVFSMPMLRGLFTPEIKCCSVMYEEWVGESLKLRWAQYQNLRSLHAHCVFVCVVCVCVCVLCVCLSLNKMCVCQCVQSVDVCVMCVCVPSHTDHPKTSGSYSSTDQPILRCCFHITHFSSDTWVPCSEWASLSA